MILAPSYLYYNQTTNFKPVVDLRLQHLMFKDPVLALRHTLGLLKPLALAGAGLGVTYTLFYRYFWESLNIQNNFLKTYFGHAFFGGISVGMLAPQFFAYGFLGGSFIGRIIRICALSVGVSASA